MSKLLSLKQVEERYGESSKVLDVQSKALAVLAYKAGFRQSPLELLKTMADPASAALAREFEEHSVTAVKMFTQGIGSGSTDTPVFDPAIVEEWNASSLRLAESISKWMASPCGNFDSVDLPKIVEIPNSAHSVVTALVEKGCTLQDRVEAWSKDTCGANKFMEWLPTQEDQLSADLFESLSILARFDGFMRQWSSDQLRTATTEQLSPTFRVWTKHYQLLIDRMEAWLTARNI